MNKARVLLIRAGVSGLMKALCLCLSGLEVIAVAEEKCAPQIVSVIRVFNDGNTMPSVTKVYAIPHKTSDQQNLIFSTNSLFGNLTLALD